MTVISHILSTTVVDLKKVFDALSTKEGLEAWLAVATGFNSRIDEISTFHFAPNCSGRVRLVERIPEHRVMWEFKSGDPEWIGTTLAFEMEPAGDSTNLKMYHSGWEEQTTYFAQCNYRWAFYMKRLKTYLETGKKSLSRF